MKTICASIKVEHIPTRDIDEPEELQSQPGESGKLMAGEINETFILSVNQDIDDREPTGPRAEKLILELGRRYRNLNARKTN